MTANHIDNLIAACDTVARRCTEIAGTRHGSAWLLRNLVQVFETSDAVNAISIPVTIGSPVNLSGVATIWRDGHLAMHTGEHTGHEGEEYHAEP